MRADGVRRAGVKLAPLNEHEGRARRLQSTLLAVKATGVQRGYRDALKEHVQVQLLVEAAEHGEDRLLQDAGQGAVKGQGAARNPHQMIR